MAKKAKPESNLNPEGPATDATDAEIAALEAELAGEGDETEHVHTLAPPIVAPLEYDATPEPNILIEGGLRIEVDPDQHRSFRVRAKNGDYYDHCKDSADGEWVYRRAS